MPKFSDSAVFQRRNHRDSKSVQSHHVPTLEAKLAPIIFQSPKLATAHESCEGLNKFIGSDIALGGILPHLDRLHDFPAFAQTCRDWNNLARIARATHPSCARDVCIAVEFGLHNQQTGGSKKIHADGEYEILYRGLGPPMVIYCHNMLSNRPTEFISLKGTGQTNYSYAPSAGSCRGTSVRTVFTKLRFDSWSLTVKTDDYTFAKTVGGPLRQTDWNGARYVDLHQVPYATARDSLPHGHYGMNHSRAMIEDPEATGDWPLLCEESGRAMLDLRGTGFGVEDASDSAFGCMGFSASGRIAVQAETTGGCHQWIHIAGGGYAGRLAPRADRTLDETAIYGNHDDEGQNGGWVLPLKIVGKEEEGDTKEESKWTVTQAKKKYQDAELGW